MSNQSNAVAATPVVTYDRWNGNIRVTASGLTVTVNPPKISKSDLDSLKAIVANSASLSSTTVGEVEFRVENGVLCIGGQQFDRKTSLAILEHFPVNGISFEPKVDIRSCGDGTAVVYLMPNLPALHLDILELKAIRDGIRSSNDWFKANVASNTKEDGIRMKRGEHIPPAYVELFAAAVDERYPVVKVEPKVEPKPAPAPAAVPPLVPMAAAVPAINSSLLVSNIAPAPINEQVKIAAAPPVPAAVAPAAPAPVIKTRQITDDMGRIIADEEYDSISGKLHGLRVVYSNRGGYATPFSYEMYNMGELKETNPAI